jgi:hypothetical protein
MIHLVADAERITAVVDARDATMEEIVAAISSRLSDG